MSSFATTTTGMVTSAADIIVKPVQAFTRSSSSSTAHTHYHHDDAVSSPTKTNSSSDVERTVYGRPAALDLPPERTNTQQQKQPPNRAAAAAIGCASGVGGFFKSFGKGFSLDMPLAVSEGLRNAPRLYGGEVYDPGRVTDWKSGGAAAGKNFVHGLVEGLGGIVTEPVKGARRDGALGAAKGTAVGLLNMGTKFSSGVLGLVALSGQGLYLSGRSLVHGDTRKMIMEATKAEGEHAAAVGRGKGLEIDRRAVLEAFDRLVRG
jgi:hypothetical protein